MVKELAGEQVQQPSPPFSLATAALLLLCSLWQSHPVQAQAAPRVLSSYATNPAATTPHAEEAHLKTVEKAGRALAAKVQGRETLRLPTLGNPEEVNKFLAEHACPGYRYRAYRQKFGGEDYVYLVASRKEAVIIGQHFRAPLVQNRARIGAASASAGGCLSLGKPPRNRHMQWQDADAGANEFLVMQSILFNLTLEVRGPELGYTINRGRITAH